MATDQQHAWNDSFPGRRPAHWAKARLTPEQRADIKRRLDDGEDSCALALEFGVSRRSIEHYR